MSAISPSSAPSYCSLGKNDYKDVTCRDFVKNLSRASNQLSVVNSKTKCSVNTGSNASKLPTPTDNILSAWKEKHTPQLYRQQVPSSLHQAEGTLIGKNDALSQLYQQAKDKFIDSVVPDKREQLKAHLENLDSDETAKNTVNGLLLMLNEMVKQEKTPNQEYDKLCKLLLKDKGGQKSSCKSSFSLDSNNHGYDEVKKFKDSICSHLPDDFLPSLLQREIFPKISEYLKSQNISSQKEWENPFRDSLTILDESVKAIRCEQVSFEAMCAKIGQVMSSLTLVSLQDQQPAAPQDQKPTTSQDQAPKQSPDQQDISKRVSPQGPVPSQPMVVNNYTYNYNYNFGNTAPAVAPIFNNNNHNMSNPTHTSLGQTQDGGFGDILMRARNVETNEPPIVKNSTLIRKGTILPGQVVNDNKAEEKDITALDSANDNVIIDSNDKSLKRPISEVWEVKLPDSFIGSSGSSQALPSFSRTSSQTSKAPLNTASDNSTKSKNKVWEPVNTANGFVGSVGSSQSLGGGNFSRRLSAEINVNINLPETVTNLRSSEQSGNRDFIKPLKNSVKNVQKANEKTEFSEKKAVFSGDTKINQLNIKNNHVDGRLATSGKFISPFGGAWGMGGFVKPPEPQFNK